MNALRDTLIEATELAGSIQERHLQQGVTNLGKFGGGATSEECVTIADKECEEALREFFAERLRGYNFCGEEEGGKYDGNGKIIYVDPIDGTKSYLNGTADFGTIVGVYENGVNIGGIVSNTKMRIKYVATRESGFERIGSPDPQEKGAIYISKGIKENAALMQEILAAVQKEFPDNPIPQSSNILHRARVYDGAAVGYFHPSLALHDIAANPLFAELTGVPTTDHNGVPYTTIDAEKEQRRYDSGKKESVYSKSLLVGSGDYYQKLLKVLARFKDALDKFKTAS